MNKGISALLVGAAAVLAAYSAMGNQAVKAVDRLPMPKYHHIHLNSVDPQRSLDWYSKYWPAGKITTVAGFPAFEGGNGLSLLYTKVGRQPAGAFDPKQQRSVPQTAFWTFGSVSSTRPAWWIGCRNSIRSGSS